MNVIKTMFFFVAVTLLPTIVGASEQEIVRGTVLSRSEFPLAPSGVMTSWVSLSLAQEPNATHMNLYVIYLSDKQDLPEVGRFCVFRVHRERVAGAVGREWTTVLDARVVDSFECK